MPTQATAAKRRPDKSKPSNRPDAYEATTSAVLAALERGTVPWRRPWQAAQGVPARNVQSANRYRGVNWLMLAMAGYESPWWLTYKQAKSRDAQVRRGEHGTPVVFWRTIRHHDPARVQAARAQGRRVGHDDDGRPYVETMVSRLYRVFNADQVDGLDETYRSPEFTAEPRWEPVAVCEEIARGYRPGPDLVEGGPAASYAPAEDRVRMPDRGRFERATDWHAALFHELAHSTGHPSRLHRADLTGGHRFATKPYAREELTAELAAAMLCTEAGIDSEPLTDSHASYIDHWRQRIGEDVRLVMSAAQRAQRACGWILGDRDQQNGGR